MNRRVAFTVAGGTGIGRLHDRQDDMHVALNDPPTDPSRRMESSPAEHTSFSSRRQRPASGRPAYARRGQGRLSAPPPPGHPRPMHDERYRTVFAFPRMVEDLLRGFAPHEWAAALDFSTLRKVPAEYVSDERPVRRGDTVWQVCLHDRGPMLVVLECQSSEEPRMALRILAYTSLPYRELVRNEASALDDRGRLPAVLPVVVHNGESPWTAAREVSELVQPVPGVLMPYRPSQRHRVVDARHVGVDDLPECNLMTAVVRLEQTRTPWDLVGVARRLRRWLRRPEDDGLRRVLAEWVREVAESFVPGGEALAPEIALEEVEMTVVERAREWSRQLIGAGHERGMREGVVAGSQARPRPRIRTGDRAEP